MAKLTHVGKKGEPGMVDVSAKPVTNRRAVAQGTVILTEEIVRAINSNSVVKGNVLEVARIGAIQAAKKTAELIPLCHPLPVSHIAVEFGIRGVELRIRAEVSAEAKTGVEMEALTAVSVACLVVYDMCKGIDKGMRIGPIELIEKEGGKSGLYRKKEAASGGKLKS